MRLIEEQAKRENIQVTFPTLLATSVFATNATTNVGGVTPYQVVYGRQPSFLPELPADPDQPVGESADGRDRQRLREIGINSMVQATAAAKIQRALKTSTSAPKFKKGELVDIFRKPGSKDMSGWSGPYTVSDDYPAEGHLTVKIAGTDRPYRYGDVRLSMLCIQSFFEGINGSADTACSIIIDYVNNMRNGHYETFGYILAKDGAPTLTAASQKDGQVLAAIQFITNNVFQLLDTTTVRIGKGVAKFGPLEGVDQSEIFWWMPSDPQNLRAFFNNMKSADMREIIGDDWPKTGVMQCMTLPDHSALVLPEAVEQQQIADNASSPPDDASSQASGNRLSTIQEMTEEGQVSDEELMAFAREHFDDMQDFKPEQMREIYFAFKEDLADAPEEHEETFATAKIELDESKEQLYFFATEEGQDGPMAELSFDGLWGKCAGNITNDQVAEGCYLAWNSTQTVQRRKSSSATRTSSPWTK